MLLQSADPKGDSLLPDPGVLWDVRLGKDVADPDPAQNVRRDAWDETLQRERHAVLHDEDAGVDQRHPPGG